MLDGRIRAVEREDRGRAWLAWHIEALSRSGKKFPKFRDFVGDDRRRRKKRPKTPEELWALAKGWDRLVNLANAQREARRNRPKPTTPAPKPPRTT